MTSRRLAPLGALAASLALLVGAVACASSGAAFTSSAANTASGCPPDAAHLDARVLGQAIGPAGSPQPTRDPGVHDPQVALRQICSMMQRSAAAWNRGDLDAFANDYMDGVGTTYIGSRGIVRGRAAIREVYAPRFAPGGVRDSLSFERVEVDLLAPDLANTIAWYVLMRGDSVTARGPTSLVMRRVKGSWKIVHDHSS
jgi:uncharacterized protein (TIGR02246 family)